MNVNPIDPIPTDIHVTHRVAVSTGQGRGFHETRGYTNLYVGRPQKLTRKPRNGNAGVN